MFLIYPTRNCSSLWAFHTKLFQNKTFYEIMQKLILNISKQTIYLFPWKRPSFLLLLRKLVLDIEEESETGEAALFFSQWISVLCTLLRFSLIILSLFYINFKMNIYVFVKELNPDGCLYRFTKGSIKNCLICEQQKICLQLYNVFFFFIRTMRRN